MTLIVLLVVLVLLFGGGGFWGYRSGYYGPAQFSGGVGLVVVLVLLFLLSGWRG